MQGANEAELKSVRNKAAEAIVDFIRFPDQYQFDLLEADAVVQLREDPDFSVLYQLLSILLRSANIKVGGPTSVLTATIYREAQSVQAGGFCTLCIFSTLYGAVMLRRSTTVTSEGRQKNSKYIISLLGSTLSLPVQDFDGFVESHPEVLETVKVPLEDIRAKARILVLLSIASQENELSFAAIKVRIRLSGVCWCNGAACLAVHFPLSDTISYAALYGGGIA